MIEKWYSMYEGLREHPKLCYLRKELNCSNSSAAGIVVFLWGWALEQAEETGLLMHRDEKEIARFLQYACMDETLNYDIVVEKLIKCGWLDKKDDGIYIHNWSDRQKYWNRYKSKLKADSERRKKTEEEKIAEEKSPKKNTVKKNDSSYSDDFIQFWEKYPRKADKGAAFKKFKARVEDGFNPKDLILAAECYANECRKLRTQPQYIKQAKTFLSDSLPFSDYIVKEVEEPLQGNPFAKYLPRDEIEL